MKRIIYLFLSLSLVVSTACSDDDNKTIDNGNMSENSSLVICSSGMENSHSYVDLGLPSGTLWAACNVGASTPYENGNYYAWGETSPKTVYDYSSYKFGDAKHAFTKYCTLESCGKSGFVDNKVVLDLSDDAAHVNWGGKWVMPTEEQLTELYKECYWVWTDSYDETDISGYVVYKATKGNKGKVSYHQLKPEPSYSLADIHIFIPASGFRCCRSLEGKGVDVGIWSSSLNPIEPSLACFVDNDADNLKNNYGYRYCGQTVRPVFVP